MKITHDLQCRICNKAFEDVQMESGEILLHSDLEPLFGCEGVLMKIYRRAPDVIFKGEGWPDKDRQGKK